MAALFLLPQIRSREKMKQPFRMIAASAAHYYGKPERIATASGAGLFTLSCERQPVGVVGYGRIDPATTNLHRPEVCAT